MASYIWTFTIGLKILFKSFPQLKMFRLVQFENIFNIQYCKCDLKIDFCFLMRRKHSGEKGENAGNQHFLLFPHNVFKRLLPLKLGIVC